MRYLFGITLSLAGMMPLSLRADDFRPDPRSVQLRPGLSLSPGGLDRPSYRR